MIIYIFQKLIWFLSLILFKFFLHFKIKNKKNFKLLKKNQFFIVSNHKGYFDAFLISVSIPFFLFLKTNFRYMTKPDWLNVYPFIKILGAYAIYRKNNDSFEKKMELTENFIKEGKNLLIFPEGTFSKNKKTLPAKQGIGYLSKKYNNIPILPVFLENSECVNKGKKINFKKILSRKHHIKIIIGKPFYYKDVADYKDDNLTVAQKIMERVNIIKDLK